MGRNDVISINHRVAAFLASYFDFIFAVNEIRRPGEKKLLKFIKNNCTRIPDYMEKNLLSILGKSGVAGRGILEDINELVDNLDRLLTKLNA